MNQLRKEVCNCEVLRVFISLSSLILTTYICSSGWGQHYRHLAQ